MGDVSRRFLVKKYLDMLNDEAFLVQVEEALVMVGEHREADIVRREIEQMKAERLQLNEVMSRVRQG